VLRKTYTRQWTVHVVRIIQVDWLTCQYDTDLGENILLGDLKVDDETPTGPSGLNLDRNTSEVAEL
jgi:hypothetical protein